MTGDGAGGYLIRRTGSPDTIAVQVVVSLGTPVAGNENSTRNQQPPTLVEWQS